MQLNPKDIINNLFNVLIEINRTIVIESNGDLAVSPRVQKHLTRINSLLTETESAKPSLMAQARNLITELKQSGKQGLQSFLSPNEQNEFMPVFSKLDKTPSDDIDKLLEDADFLKSLQKLNSKLESADPKDKNKPKDR